MSVNRFRVERDALPGEYHYRLLIVQSKKRVREFRGKLQLIVDYERNGKLQPIDVLRDQAKRELGLVPALMVVAAD